LKLNGIDVINKQNEQSGLKKDIFSKINNEEKAYWLGFLYADGSIDKNESIISLCLKESDLDHIKKFKTFIGTSNKISYRHKVKAYRLDFRCKSMKEDLVKLGCVPNKTWILSELPNIPEKFKKHFLRGYFDGDGCISFANIRKDGTCLPAISIVSNQKMLKAICDFLEEPYRPTKKAGTEVCSIRWTGTKAIRILNFIYENSTVYLERKYNRYKIFKENGFAARKSDFPSY
jgi:hypothetical protein